MLQARFQQPTCKSRPRYVEEVQIESDIANASELFRMEDFDVSRAFQSRSGYANFSCTVQT